MSKAKEIIKKNIIQYGYHVYMIIDGSVPRFCYTIGMSERCGFELILAGAYIYSGEDVELIMRKICAELELNSDTNIVRIEGLGVFTINPVERSWVAAIMLGAVDYYEGETVRAFQIIPDYEHQTIDIPNMSEAMDVEKEPAWRWSIKPWTFSAPKNSVAITNLESLRGKKIIEAARWEIDYWELFSVDPTELDHTDTRAVPLGTLISVDPSLIAVVNLEVGSALRRETSESPWLEWIKSV